ncbi:alpha/beta fold hydrolase [Micromonospora coriariae]|uniref:alpha/beta fold hydrolase n=1 Tax=Micromonospora coriariae TaxID=285665 RepID=UPI0012FD36DB|nr:alpha/beta hydrolase [Micromonospora coriariae]
MVAGAARGPGTPTHPLPPRPRAGLKKRSRPSELPVGTARQPDDYRLDTYVRFLHAVVEHLGEPRVYLLGHSHGGFVAQRYVLAHQDQIAGLARYDTSPVTGAEFWAEAMAGLAAYPQRHPDRPEATAVPAAFAQLSGATDDGSLGAALRAALPVYFADFWGRRDDFAPFQAAVRIWFDAGRRAGPHALRRAGQPR